MKNNKISARLGWLVAGAALIGATAPAFAQDDEAIVVEGHYGRSVGNAQTASQTVSYADLDLSTEAGRMEFKHRLNLTARYLCNKLGEPDTATLPADESCRHEAVRNAMSRVGTVEAHFAPRGTAWVPGTRWAAPYPTDWQDPG